jgi:hypothetical protein
MFRLRIFLVDSSIPTEENGDIMTIYTIKSICTFEIEAENDEQAKTLYNTGSWDQNDLVDESGIELATRDENGDYHVLL